MLSQPESAPADQPAAAGKRKKRMLEVSRQGDKTLVVINYSSLELIQTCLRKAYYNLQLGLVTEDAPALAFGSAIHKALEHWYTLPLGQRTLPTGQKDRVELMAYGHHLDMPLQGPAESCRQFVLSGRRMLGGLDDGDKRSLTNGLKILQAYFRRFSDDRFEVARDADNQPLIERSFEFQIYDSPGLEIRYHGTIDVVLRNIDTGVLVVADHKTTSQLGTEFYNRCKPNPQYTGYVWGAQQCLGLDTNMFMVNGIQVAKTKQEFARQITQRTKEDFDELRASVVEQVHRYLHALRYDNWTQSAPNPCSIYGGCAYLPICEVPKQLRSSVIKAKWPDIAANKSEEVRVG